MKKILLVLALVASVATANAQNVKSESAAKSALESAKAAADNEKKATKVATWLKLASSYMDAYNAPRGNGWVGASAQELQLVMGGTKATSEEAVEVGGQAMTKKSYASADYYFNANGQLAVIKVTKPIVEDALGKALDAYKKAASVDNGSKTADITKGIKNVAEKYAQEAYDEYTFGNMAAASKAFEAAANASATAPLNEVDGNSIYNAGFTALQAGEKDRAKSLFEQCIANKYYGEDGDVYAKLADVTTQLGDAKKAKDILEEGFKAFPSSQAILIGLINYYVSSGEDTDKLFSLIDDAKKNEPNNPSLYYVEGNINKELGNLDAAVSAYNKCAEVDPTYVFGYIGAGQLYYNNAVDIQEKAQAELDDAKYTALVEEFEKSLKNCIEPFEKAYNNTDDDEIKVSIAEYLKNASYRFRDEDPSYQTMYEKYSAVVTAGTAK